MYKIVLFSIALILSTSNLLAEFDTLWTKNDNRLINAEFAVLDENTILTYMWVNSDINSNPNMSGNEIKLVKYNVNDQTFTEFSSIYTEKVSIPKYIQNASINISKDKSKVFALEYDKESETTIIIIFNTADGSLEKTIEISDFKNITSVKNNLDNNVSILLESKTEFYENEKDNGYGDEGNTKGKPKKYVAIIDIQSNEINYIPAPSKLEKGESEIYDFEIIKSQLSSNPEVYYHFRALFQFGIASYDLYTEEEFWVYVSYDYSTAVNQIQFIRNYEYLIFIINKGHSFVFNAQETKNGIDIDDNILSEIIDASPIGKDINDEYLFLKHNYIKGSGNEKFNYSLHDITTQNELEIIFLEFPTNEFFGGNGREINRIKAINDSTYFSVIDGTLIKFLLKDYQLSLENPITLESIYPNPTKENIILDFELDTPQHLEWQLIDLNGRELLTNTGHFAQGKNKLEINVANLENGIYFLKVGNKTSKFVISR